MRDILVERARSKMRQKRGGGRRRVDFDNLKVATDAPAADLLELDEALERLQREHPREYEIVLLRFFTGLTNKETAEMLNMSLRKVERDWRFTRAWLHRALVDPDEKNAE